MDLAAIEEVDLDLGWEEDLVEGAVAAPVVPAVYPTVGIGMGMRLPVVRAQDLEEVSVVGRFVVVFGFAVVDTVEVCVDLVVGKAVVAVDAANQVSFLAEEHSKVSFDSGEEIADFGSRLVGCYTAGEEMVQAQEDESWNAVLKVCHCEGDRGDYDRDDSASVSFFLFLQSCPC